MGIGIRIENEHGELLGSESESTHPGNPDYLKWLLLCIDVSCTTCLRFIDPYGDTTFNRAQAKVLLEELGAAQKVVSEEAIAAAVEKRRAQLRHFNISDHEGTWSPTPSELDTFVSRLSAMIEIVLEGPHRYIKFVGD